MKKILIAVLAIAAALTLLPSVATAADDGNQKANASIVGMWEMSTPLGVFAVARFAADQTITQVNFNAAATDVHMPSAIGEWRRCTEAPCTSADKNRFEFTLYMYDYQTGLKMRIRGRLTVVGDEFVTDDVAGDALFFDFMAPGSDDVFMSFPLTHSAKRLPFLRPPS